MEQKKKKLTGQQGELMRALDITPDDLIANDEGYISERQHETVLKRQSYQLQTFKILTGVFGTIGIIFTGAGIANSEELLPLLIIGLVFASLAVFFGGISVLHRQKVKEELQKNRFETTQGIAVVNVTDKQSQLEINGLKLNASPDVLRRVRHLDPYIIHYLPDTKVILSMEHIPEESNIREDAASSRLQDTVEDDVIDDEQGNQQQSEMSS